MYDINYLKKIVTNLIWLDNHAEKETPEFLIVKGMISKLPFLDRVSLLESILGMPDDNDMLSLPYTKGHFNLFFDIEYCKIHPKSNKPLIIDELAESEAKKLSLTGDELAYEKFNWIHQIENIDSIEINNYSVRLEEKIINKISFAGTTLFDKASSLEDIEYCLYNINAKIQFRQFLYKKLQEPILNYSDKLILPTIAKDYLIVINNQILSKNIIELTNDAVSEMLNKIDEIDNYKINKVSVNLDVINIQNLQKFFDYFFKEYLDDLEIDIQAFHNFILGSQLSNIDRAVLNRNQLLKIMGVFQFLIKRNAFEKIKKIHVLRLIYSFFQTKLSVSMLKKIYNEPTTFPKKNTLKNYSLLWNELSV